MRSSSVGGCPVPCRSDEGRMGHRSLPSRARRCRRARRGSSEADGALRLLVPERPERRQARCADHGYKALFRKAVRLPNIGSGICFGLAYAVSPGAQKARKADLSCTAARSATSPRLHFASSAFCSTGGTCVGTAGSLKRFAAELKSAGQVVQGMECLGGAGNRARRCTGSSACGRRDQLGQLPRRTRAWPRSARSASRATVLIYRRSGRST